MWTTAASPDAQPRSQFNCGAAEYAALAVRVPRCPFGALWPALMRLSAGSDLNGNARQKFRQGNHAGRETMPADSAGKYTVTWPQPPAACTVPVDRLSYRRSVQVVPRQAVASDSRKSNAATAAAAGLAAGAAVAASGGNGSSYATGAEADIGKKDSGGFRGCVAGGVAPCIGTLGRSHLRMCLLIKHLLQAYFDVTDLHDVAVLARHLAGTGSCARPV